MGATSSIVNFDIYISYPEKNEYVDFLENQLKSLNYNVINSSLLKNSINEEINSSEIRKCMKTVFEKIRFVIICLSKNSVKSYTQSFELNEFVENTSFDINKIIYLMIDDNYKVNNYKYFENYIQNKRWFPFYDEETSSNSIDKILSIVFSS
jgi:hypothetical protein